MADLKKLYADSLVMWCMLVISAPGEKEVGGSLEVTQAKAQDPLKSKLK
jgi:hypothetical protein